MEYKIENGYLFINRNTGKNWLLGRAKGDVAIKLSEISGMNLFADYLVIYAEGFHSPDGGTLGNIAALKRLPTVFVGKVDVLQKLYNEIIENTANL